jgi:hypothetical protein
MDCPRFISERRDIFNFFENDDTVFPKWELPMLLEFSHVLDIAMAIEDPRVEPFVEWSDEIENPSDNSRHSGDDNPDELDIQSQDTSSAQPSGARAAGAAFRAAMEAVLNNLNNSTDPVSQTMTHNNIAGGLVDARTVTRVNEITEARFNAAMEAVLNEPSQRRTHTADISAEVSTQGTDIHDRRNIEERNADFVSENNLDFNNRALDEGELPNIDQPLSDESYPSNSALSFNHENENYDKTPEFDPEWDPG